MPGFAIHEELSHLVEAGLSPYEALRAGTRDAARFLELEDEFGTVTVGKRADLLLVDANPLDDVANVGRRLGVMARGRWYSEADLHARLEALVQARINP
jgi:imidazolonepropionase-like amidohydrolase